jgi:hypothetical protein
VGAVAVTPRAVAQAVQRLRWDDEVRLPLRPGAPCVLTAAQLLQTMGLASVPADEWADTARARGWRAPLPSAAAVATEVDVAASPSPSPSPPEPTVPAAAAPAPAGRAGAAGERAGLRTRVSDLSQCTTPQLRLMCKARGVNAIGPRNELLTRLALLRLRDTAQADPVYSALIAQTAVPTMPPQMLGVERRRRRRRQHQAEADGAEGAEGAAAVADEDALDVETHDTRLSAPLVTPAALVANSAVRAAESAAPSPAPAPAVLGANVLHQQQQQQQQWVRMYLGLVQHHVPASLALLVAARSSQAPPP